MKCRLNRYTLDDVTATTKYGGRSVRNGFLIQFMEIEIEDVRGKIHRLTDKALTSNPWLARPAMYVGHLLNHWEMGGVTGYGEVQDLCK